MKALEKGDYIIFSLIAAVVLIGVGSAIERQDAATPNHDYAADAAADSDDMRGYPIDRVDRTLSAQERSNWESDSESYGFSDEDRAFAAEHGIDESELRAAETILRENGIE